MISKLKTDFIRTLGDESGHIEPGAVVNAARDPACPIHDEFEWDNETAADQHRLDQARALIRFVKLEVTIQRQTRLVPYYVVDPARPPGSQRYVELQVAGRDRQMALRIFQDELDRIVAAIRRAQDVAAVLGLGDELERFLDQWHLLKTASERKRSEAEAKRKAKKGKRSQRRGGPSELRA